MAKKPDTLLVDLTINEVSAAPMPKNLLPGWITLKSMSRDGLQKPDSLLQSGPDADGNKPGGDVTTETKPTAESFQKALDEAKQLRSDVQKALEENESLREELSKASTVAEAADKRVEKLEKANEDMATVVQRMLDDKDQSEARKSVEKWARVPGVDDDFAPVLAKLRKADDDGELAAAVEKVLDTFAEAMSKAGVFKELGTPGSPDGPPNAMAAVDEDARKILEKGDAPTIEQARVIAMSRRPELYEQYLADEAPHVPVVNSSGD